MKHLVILTLISLGIYAAWKSAKPSRRTLALDFAKRHAGPLFFLAAALFVLVAAAISFPSASIF